MKSIKQLREELGELQINAMAVVKLAEEENRELTDEEQKVVDEASDSPLKEQLARAERVEALRTEFRGQSLVNRLEQRVNEEKPVIRFPSQHVGKLRSFKTMEEAYTVGQWALGTIMGRQKSLQWCREHGVLPQQAMTTGDNTQGGFLVPEPLENAVIILREEFGAFRRNMRMNWPLNNGTLAVPKLTGEITTFYVGENATPTASDIALGSVKLSAKKLAALCGPISNELNEDAAVSVAELVAGSMAHGFAIAEDQAAFNGTGGSDTGGIVGFGSKLAAGAIRDAIAGQNTWDLLTLKSFHNAKARIRPYPGAVNKWYCHSEFYYSVMEPLQVAAGGSTVADVANGGQLRFLGLPVEFTQVLPRVSAASSIVAYVGDVSMAAVMGTARGMSVRVSTEKYFTEDALAILATQRYDINIHDVGTSTVGAAVVGFRTAA